MFQTTNITINHYTVHRCFPMVFLNNPYFACQNRGPAPIHSPNVAAFASALGCLHLGSESWWIWDFVPLFMLFVFSNLILCKWQFFWTFYGILCHLNGFVGFYAVLIYFSWDFNGIFWDICFLFFKEMGFWRDLRISNLSKHGDFNHQCMAGLELRRIDPFKTWVKATNLLFGIFSQLVIFSGKTSCWVTCGYTCVLLFQTCPGRWWGMLCEAKLEIPTHILSMDISSALTIIDQRYFLYDQGAKRWLGKKSEWGLPFQAWVSGTLVHGGCNGL